MDDVNRPASHSATAPPGPKLLGLSPVVAGTACCVVSALGYSGASICLRHLADECDPVWVIFNKELVTVLVVGPWLLYRTMRGLRSLPSGRVLARLVLIGLAVQLGANLGVQWALGIVGLAVTIPTMFGVMLAASGVLGMVFLGEHVSRRSAMAIGLLVVSLLMLGLAASAPASAAGKSTEVATPLLIGLAVGAACLAGAIYAVLTISIRHAVTGTTPASTIVFVTTLMGVLTLGPLSFCLLGTEKLLSTPPQHFAWMLAAGTLNLVAFLAITKGLQLTTVVHANVLNASQVAMAAVAGTILFTETPTRWMIVGVVLTIVGIILIDRPKNGDRDADQHA